MVGEMLNLLQKNLISGCKDVGEMCEKNMYSVRFLLTIADLKRTKIGEIAATQSATKKQDPSLQQHNSVKFTLPCCPVRL